MEGEAPEAWVGKLVQVVVMNDEQFTGHLEAINMYGITFRPTDDGQPMFMPFHTILWIVLAE